MDKNLRSSRNLIGGGGVPMGGVAVTCMEGVTYYPSSDVQVHVFYSDLDFY